MIDRDVLRHLGWTEELISEVNRVADAVERSAGGLEAISTSNLTLSASSAEYLSHDCAAVTGSSSLVATAAHDQRG